MMFHVRWEAAALNEFTTNWTDADSSMRKAITAATHKIDQQLQTNPYEQGESRLERRRIHFVFPLAVLFRIEPDEQTVSVLHVWRFDRQTPTKDL